MQYADRIAFSTDMSRNNVKNYHKATANIVVQQKLSVSASTRIQHCNEDWNKHEPGNPLAMNGCKL
jgi:hypothetical protein